MPFGSLKVDPLEWKGKGESDHHLPERPRRLRLAGSVQVLGLCRWAWTSTPPSSTPSPAWSYTTDDLLTCGERIYNLERYYNNLAGFGEGSDYLPKRFTDEPSTMPGSEGHVCELDLMLEEYYATRGWENGVVPESKLKELEII